MKKRGGEAQLHALPVPASEVGMYSAHTVLRIPHDLNYKKHFTLI
jgi:hypothetical protein